MRKTRSLVVALLSGTVLLGAVPLAHATFLASAQATANFSADQLAPASNLAVKRRCTVSLLGVVLGAELDATWNASSSSWVGGYRAELLDNNGVVLQTQSTSAGVRSVTFTLADLLTTTYQVRVTATYASWTSSAILASNSSC